MGPLPQIGQSEQAINAFQNIITIQPNHVDALITWAMLSEIKVPDESIASYNLALSVDPAYADAHYNMGNAFKDQGKLDESIASYCKALFRS